MPGLLALQHTVVDEIGHLVGGGPARVALAEVADLQRGAQTTLTTNDRKRAEQAANRAFAD